MHARGEQKSERTRGPSNAAAFGSFSDVQVREQSPSFGDDRAHGTIVIST
jgi:hypothetical protein